MWWMSAPIATCTVTGIPSRARGGQDRAAAMRIPAAQDLAPDRLPHAEALLGAAPDRAVQRLGRLARHPEAAVVERARDVLAGAPHHRELEVVDADGAVHEQARREPALQQIHHQGREPHLHDVRAEAPEQACGRGRGRARSRRSRRADPRPRASPAGCRGRRRSCAPRRCGRASSAIRSLLGRRRALVRRSCVRSRGGRFTWRPAPGRAPARPARTARARSSRAPPGCAR